MSKTQPEQLPKILIASYSEASKLLLAQENEGTINHLISIGDPGQLPPPGWEQVPHRLRLEFVDDTIPPHPDEPQYILATPEDIAQVINFVPIIVQDGGDVLIHCQAGISRSSAVALIIYALLLGPGREEEALNCVLKTRPIAVPNTWIVKLADEALGRKGKLAKIAQIHEECLSNQSRLFRLWS